MRRVTIKDIAEHAGVSFKTVSRVINQAPSVNPDMRERVEQSMKALDYRPNRAASLLRGGKSYTMGLALGPLTDFLEPESGRSLPTYITDVITGLIQSCSREGYHLLIEPITSQQIEGGKGAIDRLLDDLALDGLILIPPLCDRLWLLDHLANKRVPCVRLSPGKPHERSISIGIDDDKAGTDLAEYLLSRHHRRIGYIAGPPEHGAHGLRWEACKRVFAGHEEVEIREVPGNFDFESGWDGAAALLADRHNWPSVIFAANDEMAAGVLAYAKSAEIAVPAELSVMGFGNLAVARQCWPRLTTVRVPTIEIGRAAASELIAAVVNQDFIEGKVIYHPHRMIERDTMASA